MKSLTLLRAGAVSLACLGILVPTPVLRAAVTEAAQVEKGNGAALTMLDVALHPEGTLIGQVLDAQGKPLARIPVSVHQHGRRIAGAVSDGSGMFRVAGLRGGMYHIVAGKANGVYRLWAPDTAPPSAQPGALVVEGGQQVLGQYGHICQWLCNPWVVLGLVAAAIAIPVAIHNADDDEGPTSP